MLSEYNCESCGYAKNDNCPQEISSDANDREMVSNDCGLCCHSSLNENYRYLRDAEKRLRTLNELTPPDNSKTGFMIDVEFLQRIKHTIKPDDFGDYWGGDLEDIETVLLAVKKVLVKKDSFI